MVGVFRQSSCGFNGTARIDLDNDEEDPVGEMLDIAEVARRLGATTKGRGGFKLEYRDGDSRWTWAVDPIADDEAAWLATVNRHFYAIPNDNSLDEALSWFADLAAQLVARLDGLAKGPASADA
jgi:hypothetical protein